MASHVYPLSPDLIARRVLLAVELIDPVSLSLVSDGRRISVRAAGLRNRPFIVRSGRFVWLEEGVVWPGPITITPADPRYAREIVAAPPQPVDTAVARAKERLLSVRLRTTAAYPFSTGVTAIRGCLHQTAAPDAHPIPDAQVQLAWHDLNGDKWVPSPPRPEDVVDDDEGAPSPPNPQTDERGEFGVFLRLRKTPPATPDVTKGLLKVRLQFTRSRRSPMTRATPADYPFLDGGGGLPASQEGRVHEGELLARDLRLAWSDLDPI